jgi:SHS2 domain-containing protein
MNLEKILSISGKPGLYILKVQTRTGFVAESLADGKKISVSLKSNVSLLSEISIYTYEGEKPLVEIMTNIAAKENNGPAISHKEDNATLMSYFREVLTDFDEERVYPSDVKKILNWYNTLQVKGLVVTEEVTNAEVAEEAAEVVAEKPKKVKKSKE